MAKIISICNQKGGVGKTSTAISLSAGICIEGKKCLLVDLDPQGNATSGLGIDKASVQNSIYNCLILQEKATNCIINTCVENLKLIPSNNNLSGAEIELVSEIGREWKLKKTLSEIESEYDFIFLDCPPSLGLLSVNSLACSNSVLIPIQCEYYALEGLGQLMKTISLIKENLNQSLEVEGILMTMADFRTKLTQEVIDEVKKHFGNKVYNTIIPRNIKLSESPGFGKPIYLYDNQSEGSKKYMDFTKEFLSINDISKSNVSPVTDVIVNT